jgi:hypothetical protein
MTNKDSALYLTWLKTECGYLDLRPIDNAQWVGIVPLMYTHAIIIGRLGDMTGYENRWCYESYDNAKAALDAWDGRGEPQGWHRHPISGRRRSKDGLEYVTA